MTLLFLQTGVKQIVDGQVVVFHPGIYGSLIGDCVAISCSDLCRPGPCAFHH